MMGNASITAMLAAASFSLTAYTAADGVVTQLRPASIEGRGFVSGPVFPGELATVRWDIIKRVDCPGQSARLWSGADGFALAEALTPTNLPPGAGTYTIPTRIPSTAPEGHLSLTISGYFECGAGQREHFSLTPIAMTVEAS